MSGDYHILRSQPHAGSPAPGRVIGHYRLLEHLHDGGGGSVFRALDLHVPRHVAMKLVHLPEPDALSEAEDRRRRRFLHEVQVLAQLRHPHIVRVYEAEILADLPYVVMEYLRGGSLVERLRQRPGLDCRQICDIMLSLVQALRYTWDAHRVIHRDLKPENVMFDTIGKVKLVDFGISAHQRRRGEGDVNHHLAGTVQYMAPERLEECELFDPRTDIYSLGILFAEMIAGRRVFHGSGIWDLLRQKRKGLPFCLRDCLSELPDLAELIEDMVYPRHELRLNNYGILEDRLTAIIESMRGRHLTFRPEFGDSSTIFGEDTTHTWQ